jgi:hypothetical protein
VPLGTESTRTRASQERTACFTRGQMDLVPISLRLDSGSYRQEAMVTPGRTIHDPNKQINVRPGNLGGGLVLLKSALGRVLERGSGSPQEQVGRRCCYGGLVDSVARIVERHCGSKGQCGRVTAQVDVIRTAPSEQCPDCR